HFASALMAA
ncbi:conserved region in glutamate synthase family protein, partial [Vibrio parahaemolyticus V-223/04]